MRGIFVYKARTGYTVHIDGFTMDLDISWSAADKLARKLADLRKGSGDLDGRGYARCNHAGCFTAGRHLEGHEKSI